MSEKIIIRHSSPQIIESDFDYVRGLIDRNYVGDGLLCDALRKEIKEISHCKYVVLTSSGTSALYLALLGLQKMCPDRSHVLISGYICPSVVSAILNAKLVPEFTDICADSLNLKMDDLPSKINARTLAVICSNIGGIPDNYQIAESLNIPVISDCAQAIGSCFQNASLLSKGCCAIVSFGSTKVLTAGTGGAFISDNEELALHVARLATAEFPVDIYRRQGFIPTVGQQFSDINAGLAVAQLRRLQEMIDRRRQIAHRYDTAIERLNGVTGVHETEDTGFNRFRYYFLTTKAKAWLEYLHSSGIDARSSISHVITSYYSSQTAPPNLLRIVDMVVSIPIYPALKDSEVDYICEIMQDVPFR